MNVVSTSEETSQVPAERAFWSFLKEATNMDTLTAHLAYNVGGNHSLIGEGGDFQKLLREARREMADILLKDKERYDPFTRSLSELYDKLANTLDLYWEEELMMSIVVGEAAYAKLLKVVLADEYTNAFWKRWETVTRVREELLPTGGRGEQVALGLLKTWDSPIWELPPVIEDILVKEEESPRE